MSVVCDRVGVTYGSYTAVRTVDLQVATGGWTTLIGANGAGKSSLLRAVAGLVAHSGRVELFAHDTRSRTRRELARMVAFVPQRPVLPPTMTVADYVHLGRTPHLTYLGYESPRDNEIVGEVLERVELTRFARRPLGQVSGGEAQRAVLARALAQDAALLVLDEPTTALDLGHQQRVLSLIDDLRVERTLTVVSSSHDLGLAGQFSDELVLLSNGQVVAAGDAREVLTVANLSRHFDADVGIVEDETGRVIVVPRRAPARASLAVRSRVNRAARSPR